MRCRRRNQPERCHQHGHQDRAESQNGTLADRIEDRVPTRAQQKRISRRTGGYSHARQRLPKQLSWQVMTELVLRLREILNPGGCPSYLLDGSSLELEASRSLRKAY